MDLSMIPNDWFEVIKITELPQSVKVFMWEYTAGQNDRFYNGFYHVPLWKGGKILFGQLGSDETKAHIRYTEDDRPVMWESWVFLDVPSTGVKMYRFIAIARLEREAEKIRRSIVRQRIWPIQWYLIRSARFFKSWFEK
jgi:hypothetical protein